MNKIDKTFSAIAIGAPIPVVLMLACWWISVPAFDDNAMMYWLLIPAGLIIGLVLDLTVLRRFMFRLFSLPMPALFALLAFYSVMVYGLFMGFPVFNTLIGIFGAYVVARSGQLERISIDIIRKNARKTHVFSLILLLLICIVTTIMALNENAIEVELKMMLNLSFEVTRAMVWALILVGALFLILFQFGISKLVFYVMAKKRP